MLKRGCFVFLFLLCFGVAVTMAQQPTGNFISHQGLQIQADFGEDWELLPGSHLTTLRGSPSLSVSKEGHAFWKKMELENFAVTCAYRHGEGIGEVLLRSTGEPPTNSEYHVQFTNTETRLVRLYGDTPTILSKTPVNLTPHTWYSLAISIINGKILVKLDGKKILQVIDPNPLPRGFLGLGCEGGSNIAFSNVKILLPSSKIGFSPSPSPPKKGTKEADLITVSKILPINVPKNSPKPGHIVQISPNVMSIVTRPLTRAKMVATLLKDKDYGPTLRNLAKKKNLDSQTLQKESVTGMPVTQDAHVSTPNTLLDAYNKGVRINLCKAWPTYQFHGHHYAIATAIVDNITVFLSPTLKDMIQKGTICLTGYEFGKQKGKGHVYDPGFIELYLDVPMGKGTYIIAIQVVQPNGSPISSDSISLKTPTGWVKLVPTSDKKAWIGTCILSGKDAQTMWPSSFLQMAAQKGKMRRIGTNISIYFASKGGEIYKKRFFLVGNITLTRL